MKIKGRETMSDSDVYSQVWDDLLDSVSEKIRRHNESNPHQKASYDDLFSFPLFHITNREAVAQILGRMDYNVNNGGFEQYIYNNAYTEPGCASAITRILNYSLNDLRAYFDFEVEDEARIRSMLEIWRSFRELVPTDPREYYDESRLEDLQDNVDANSWKQIDSLNEKFGELEVSDALGKIVAGWPERFSPFHDLDKDVNASPFRSIFLQ